MTGPTVKAKRKRYPSDDRDSDRRLIPTHIFRDIGSSVADPDFRPGVIGNPEEALAAIFARLGRDFGGPYTG